MEKLKVVLVSLLLVVSTQLVWSQDTIRLDFKTKKLDLESVQHIQKGKLYVFHIDNINMNLYDVSINKKDSVFPNRDLFPALDLLGFDAIGKVVDNIVNSVFSITGTENTNLNAKREELLIQKGVVEMENFRALSEGPNKNFGFSSLMKLKLNEFSSFEIQKLNIPDSSKKYLMDNNNKILILTSQLDSIDSLILKSKQASIKNATRKEQVLIHISDAQNQIGAQLTAVQPYFKEINDAVSKLNLQSIAYYESLDSFPKNPLIGSFSNLTMKETYELLHVLRNNVENFKKEIARIEDNYNGVKKNYKDLYESDSLIKKRDSAYIKIVADAKSSLDKELAKISQTKILEHFAALIHLENNKQRSYTSIPLQHNGNISQLEIKISAKKPEYGPSYEAKYQFPNSRFILGIGGAFYYAFSFRDDQYSVRETITSDTTSNFTIVKEEDKRGEVGFASLLHIGHRIRIKQHENIGLNFVFGPALSFAAEPQVRISFGAGLSYGPARNMVSLNALWMHGNTQRRSNVYNEGEAYLKRPDQVTISRLSQSFGLSLGYIYKF